MPGQSYLFRRKILEQHPEEIAKELRSKLEKLPLDERFMLGIVGYPGAGKSTASRVIVDAFNKLSDSEAAIVVPMDGYHFANEKLVEMNLLPYKGIPETFDANSFIALLEQIRKNQGTVKAPLFDRTIEASIEDAIEIRPQHKLVVVEGNYLLLKESPWNKIRALLNEVWFIDTALEVIYKRLIDRHKQGGRSEEGAMEKVSSTDMPNAHLIDATKIFSDRLVAVKLDNN